MPHGKPELPRVGKDERPAPDAVKGLVDHFDQNRKVFLSTDYREEQLRAEFLTPLFGSLGWDVYNKSGLSETLKQVIYEEPIKACPARSYGGAATRSRRIVA
jgi:hypothetical protein